MGRHGMGQGQSNSRWNWEFKDGRAQIKPRKAAAPPARPLFRKQPSDNYDWWIFNPDPPKNRGRDGTGSRNRSRSRSRSRGRRT